MALYRKKPVVIEAFRVTSGFDPRPRWFEVAVRQGDVVGTPSGAFDIRTLEGVMKALPGDYVIKGVNGELYPCKPDIFEKTYDPVR